MARWQFDQGLFARALMSGMQAGLRKRQLDQQEEARKDQMQAAKDRQTAIGDAMKTGDLASLYAMDPELGMRVEDAQMKRQRFEQEQNVARDAMTHNLARSLQRATDMGNTQMAEQTLAQWADMARQGRAHAPNIGDYPDYTTQGGVPSVEGPVTPDVAAGARLQDAGAQGAAAMALASAGPEADDKRDPFMRLLADPALGLSEQQQGALGRTYARSKAKTGGTATTNVNVGAGGLDKKTRTGLTEQLIDFDKTIPVLDKLLAQGERYIGLDAKLERLLKGGKDVVGAASESDKEFLREAQKYKGRIIIEARKVIKATQRGVVTDADADAYMEAFGMSKNSTPNELIGGLEMIREMAVDGAAANRALLNEGVDLGGKKRKPVAVPQNKEAAARAAIKAVRDRGGTKEEAAAAAEAAMEGGN